MTFQQELASWKSPVPVEITPAPTIGSKAPSNPRLEFPLADGKSTLIIFLRHCGCPFAEKTFRQLAHLSNKHSEVRFIAVSHSDQSSTDKWIVAVGGQWSVEVIVDEKRELYAAWGLGISSTWHVLNPWSMYSAFRLAKDEKIWNKGTESGTRWQTAGAYAVDEHGIVRWGGPAKAANDMPDLRAALKALGVNVGPERVEVATSGFL